MEAATQPMANPEGTPTPIRLRDYLRMSLRDHLRVVRESVHLYRLSLMDRDEAIREVKIDNELMRQVREAQAKTAGSSAEQSPAGAAPAAATDMEELAAKVRGMFPKDVQRVSSVQEAVQVAVDRKEDVRALATDRLETVGAALSEFMLGYREGKEAGLRDVEEGRDDMLESLMEPLKGAPSSAAAGADSARAGAAEPGSADADAGADSANGGAASTALRDSAR